MSQIAEVASRKAAVPLHQVFEQTADRAGGAVALECGQELLTYAELDRRANQLAHLLAGRGIGRGSRVGLLFERSAEMYVSLLAVLKAGGTFVPVDPASPQDRVAFIQRDVGLRLILTQERLRPATAGSRCAVLPVDASDELISGQPGHRLEVALEPGDLCYVICTSGSTGRPKGVAISHRSISNFLSVATPVYGVAPADRAYQGMSIAFDFSVEEIWPAWSVGATVVAGPAGARRLGPELGAFLAEKRITFFCCVPTLLATIDRDVPAIRTLLVGGEACPADLVRRWARPGRRMLNTYGPAETTVTATWTELTPGRAVTIGVPLPTYRVYLLDEKLRPLPRGGTGEICIGGPGVAAGYINRDDVTANRFVPNPVTADHDAPRIYRTGDLGRLTVDGEIEYLGRIDTQVKIGGRRIELGEIEQVLRAEPAVQNAVAGPLVVDGVTRDLVAYVTSRGRQDDPDLRDRLHARMRRSLPPYMVPAFIEVLDAFPMLAADKVDRKALPVPARPRMGTRSGPVVPPATPLETRIAQVWRHVLGASGFSVHDDFFRDLGGHSFAAALAVSQLRQEERLRGLSLSDIYHAPTVRSLAQAITARAAQQPPAAPDAPAPLRHGSSRTLRCGIAQVAALMLVACAVFAPAALLQTSRLDLWLVIRVGVVWLVWAVVLAAVLPVTLGRALGAGIRPGTYPLWGAVYYRWWLHRALLAMSPLAALAGSPLAGPYLRLLGARVGRRTHLASGAVGLPALVEIADEASVGYGVQIQPSLVEGGRMTLGRVRIGRRAFIGANAVLLPGSEVGDDAMVAEQSLVAREQRIPAGQRWGGSPSRPAAPADPLLEAMAAAAKTSGRPPRRAPFLAAHLALQLAPAIAVIPGIALAAVVYLHAGLWWTFAAAPPAGIAYVLSVCLVVIAGKRLVMPHARPGIHPAGRGFGVRKWVSDRLMALSLARTNSLYATLYLIPFLRLLGARIGKWSEVSTVGHIDPDLIALGDGTFVADIASLAPAVFHRGQVALGPVEVGSRAFVGNAAIVRPHTRLGAGSLLGVQSVPPDDQVEPGTSWLGSPAMFLPRRQPSQEFSERVTYRPAKRLIAARLAIEFFRVFLPAAILAAMLTAFLAIMLGLATRLPGWADVITSASLALGLGLAATLAVAGLKWLLVGRYRPRVEPLWSIFVRRSELATALYETVAVPASIRLFTGTPLIGPLLRLFGASIGRHVWLDTTYLTEFDLVRIGDDASIGGLTSLQTHLFEDRVMKMSRVRIEQGASVGSRSVVLYDAAVGDNATVDALSLVMKGETLPPRTRWHGIPATAAGPVPASPATS